MARGTYYHGLSHRHGAVPNGTEGAQTNLAESLNMEWTAHKNVNPNSAERRIVLQKTK